MYDPAAAYRATQVTSSGPAAQVVLLYQGALRFGAQHVAALERHDIPAAHRASIRCQAIVAALQAALDLSAGPIAGQLDAIYAFILRRLVDGNVRKDPTPTEEAMTLLRDLLDAWQQVAGAAALATTAHPRAVARPVAGPVPRGARPQLVAVR